MSQSEPPGELRAWEPLLPSTMGLLGYGSGPVGAGGGHKFRSFVGPEPSLPPIPSFYSHPSNDQK